MRLRPHARIINDREKVAAVVEKIGQFDVAIIGSGPGGYVAAIRAGQLGLKTLLVEKDPQPGGTCLHRGCIPTKALLQTAHVLELARESQNYGVKVGDVDFDLAEVMKYKSGVVSKNASGVEYLLKKNKVTTVNGFGRLEGATQVHIDLGEGKAQVADCKHIILATGSVPTRPGFLDFKNPRIITSDEALKMTEVPKHITILGAGAVGVEFATIFKAMGADVLIVELLDRLLPVEDEDCSKELQRAFKKRKIGFKTSHKLEKAVADDKGVELTLTSAKGKTVEVSTSYLLCAVGRSPVTEGLNLDKVGVATERGFVTITRDQRTTVNNIFAIGDIVSDTPLLAHVASAEGIVAVEEIAGMKPVPIDPQKVPGATYCHPEVASVGLTEAAAREAGHDVKTSKFPFSALGKAGIVGAKEGFFKLVADAKYGEILGVHIVGDHATDLIGEGCALLGLECTAGDLAHIIHPHPTISEGMLEAAHGLVGGAIHM